ncbi:MAG: hypothetical protein PF503_11830 [Desulfobacula sp.]|jgi:protein-arginine kinase activator protein McsA|nr:hypothetical protein [Desulfobacula sp.]
MSTCLTELACPKLYSENLFICDFCHRPAEFDVEATIDGGERSVWLCGKCDKSKQILKNWEVISL